MRSRAAAGVDLSTGRPLPILNRSGRGGYMDLIPKQRLETSWKANRGVRNEGGNGTSFAGSRGGMANQRATGGVPCEE